MILRNKTLNDKIKSEISGKINNNIPEGFQETTIQQLVAYSELNFPYS